MKSLLLTALLAFLAVPVLAESAQVPVTKLRTDTTALRNSIKADHQAGQKQNIIDKDAKRKEFRADMDKRQDDMKTRGEAARIRHTGPFPATAH